MAEGHVDWPHSPRTPLSALLKLYLGTKFDSSTGVEDSLSCESIILSLTTFLQQKIKELYLDYIFLSFINLFLGQYVFST